MKSKAKIRRRTHDVCDTLIVELNGARLEVVVDRRTFKEGSRDIVFQLNASAALHNITPNEQAESEVSPPPDTPVPGLVRIRLEIPRRVGTRARMRRGSIQKLPVW